MNIGTNMFISSRTFTFQYAVHVSPNFIGLRILFPLVLQQGISTSSDIGPHCSLNDAPVFQTSSELFGRLGMTPLSTRCYDATVRSSSSLVKTQTHTQCIPNPVAASPRSILRNRGLHRSFRYRRLRSIEVPSPAIRYPQVYWSGHKQA